MNDNNLDEAGVAVNAIMPPPQALPMRWPFRVLAGILAFGILGPFTLHIAFIKPLDGYVLAAMTMLTLRFVALSLAGRASAKSAV